MYNMQQNCNNQTHCIWRDIMTGGDWEEADLLITPPTFCTPSGSPKIPKCTPLLKLQYRYSKLKPNERLMYRISNKGSSTSTGTSNTPPTKPVTKEYCVDPQDNPGECKALLGIEPTTPSSFDNKKEYSFKVINFGCADMVGNINNKVGTTIVNPENNYLYNRDLLCSYKKFCLVNSIKSTFTDDKQRQNPNKYIKDEIGLKFDCDSPTTNATIDKCVYRDKILMLQAKVADGDNLLSAWNRKPVNTKSGVCLKPPNTIMSDNPCNLFTSQSIVTQKMFDSNPVCTGFSPEECNTDEFCYLGDNGCSCQGYCENSPAVSTSQAACNAAGNCKWDASDSKCKSVKNNWQCECLDNKNIRNLFEEDNNRCNKLQPTRDIPLVNYYGDPNKKIYMQYSDNCCYFDQTSPSGGISPSQMVSPIVYAESLIPESYKLKCDTSECKEGDKLFGQLVIPNCELIDPTLCEPNNISGKSNNSVDHTWPCKTKKIDGKLHCVNKPGREPGRIWEEDCYEDGGDGQKIFRYDTCWNPLYGVLSPCGINYPNNSFFGDLDKYYDKKCILDNCCDQDYVATPVDVKANILTKVPKNT
jgi:hypothetical protein